MQSADTELCSALTDAHLSSAKVCFHAIEVLSVACGMNSLGVAADADADPANFTCLPIAS